MRKSILALATLVAMAAPLLSATAAEPGLAAHLPGGASLIGGFDPASLPAGGVLDPATWRETPLMRHAHEALELLEAAGVDPRSEVDSLAFGVFGEPSPSGISVLTPPLVVVAVGRMDPAAMEAAAPAGLSCREVAPATVVLGRDSLLAEPAVGVGGPAVPAGATLWLSADASELGALVHSAESLLFRDLGAVVAHVSASAGAVTVEVTAEAGSDAVADERAAWTNSLLDLLRPLAVGRPAYEGAAGVEVGASGSQVVARLVLNDVQLADLAEALRPFAASPPLADPRRQLGAPERLIDEPAAAGDERGRHRRAGRR